jgi:phosphatidylserine synthase
MNMKLTGLFSALAWPALVFCTLAILSVLASAGIATWEWADGNTTPKAGWEGFPIMLIILTMVSVVASLVTLAVTVVYVLMKGPIRLPFSKNDNQNASNNTLVPTVAKRSGGTV